MRPLYILRPEPGASTSASQARAIGLEVVKVPLFEVAPLDWRAPDPEDFDGLVLTSANAVRHGGPELAKLKRLPVHAVGRATAAAARDAGFSIATVGAGGARDMPLPGGRLLRLSGRDHVAADTAATIAVYEARAIAQPPGLEQAAGCVIAVHSPRAGRRIAELVEDRSEIAIAAISSAAAQACGTGWQAIATAPQPTDEALLALVARLCESPAQ